MAMNLIKTGHDVSVWNRTASKTVQFRNEGATVYDTKRQIVENCDIIFGKKHIYPLFLTNVKLSLRFRPQSREGSCLRKWWRFKSKHYVWYSICSNKNSSSWTKTNHTWICQQLTLKPP